MLHASLLPSSLAWSHSDVYDCARGVRTKERGTEERHERSNLGDETNETVE